jgi:hypothetical protein
VELHDGNLNIRSRLGEGTRVSVRLPIECNGSQSAVEPIKLVTARANEFAKAARILVKKSA